MRHAYLYIHKDVPKDVRGTTHNLYWPKNLSELIFQSQQGNFRYAYYTVSCFTLRETKEDKTTGSTARLNVIKFLLCQNEASNLAVSFD